MQQTTSVTLSFSPISEEQYERQAAVTPFQIDSCISQAFAHRRAPQKRQLTSAELFSNGLCFSTPDNLSPGAKLCLMIDIGQNRKAIPVVGEVLFCVHEPNFPEMFWTGVEFSLMSLESEERILSHLATVSHTAHCA